VVHQVVPVDFLVEKGVDRAFLRELPRGVGVLAGLEHAEHLARNEVLQQCHSRTLVQPAAVACRLKVPKERHKPQQGVARELARGVHQGVDVRADVADGIASMEV